MTEPQTLAGIARIIAAPMAAIPLRELPVLGLIKFRKSRVWVAPLGSDPDAEALWIEVKTEPPSVPVSVLEALASAWEDRADRLLELEAWRSAVIEVEAKSLADCARMLRETITKGQA
jgi:hypothetical protein